MSKRDENMAQAAMLLQKYERKTIKTNDRFRKRVINSLLYWLSIYTAEQMSTAIDRYIARCANIGIKQRYMRRSYTFFDGNAKVSGFFESYITDSCIGSDEIQANDCFQSFQPTGGCSEYLKGRMNYCQYCTVTKQRCLLIFDLEATNASTRSNK